MSNIEEHENKQTRKYLYQGYYAPDDVIDPLIQWCRRILPLIVLVMILEHT